MEKRRGCSLSGYSRRKISALSLGVVNEDFYIDDMYCKCKHVPVRADKGALQTSFSIHRVAWIEANM